MQERQQLYTDQPQIVATVARHYSYGNFKLLFCHWDGMYWSKDLCNQ